MNDINYNRLIKRLGEAYDLLSYELWGTMDDTPEAITDAISALKRLAKNQAQVEIINCSKCKFMLDAQQDKKGFLICPASGMKIADHDFCSYAERCDPFDV